VFISELSVTARMLLLGAVRVLVVLAGDTTAESSTAVAIEQAIHASLGSDAAISMQQGDGRGEAELAREASAGGVTLVCVVTWSDAQRRATLRFLRPNESRWSDREIRFDAADAAEERGRTVGFALASMVPDEVLVADRATPPAPPALELVAPKLERPSAGVRRATRYAVDLAVQGAVALGGGGGGVGGAAAGRIGLGRFVSLRFSLGGRVAELAVAQATSRSYFAGPGIAWATPLDAAARWGIGGRLDALLLGQQVVHLSADDPLPDHRFRVLPAAAGAIEGSWRFAEQASTVLAVGTEVAFGKTDVFVHHRNVVDLVPVRPFVEAGLRVAF
jgi:hypothetical protein